MESFKIFLLVCFLLIIFILGGFVLNRSRFLNSELLKFKGQVVEIEAQVVETEPGKIILAADRERVLVFTDEPFNYGDELKIIGKIEEPIVFDDFDYQTYLRRHNIFTLIYEPKIEKISEKKFSFYKEILILRDKLAGSIDKSYPLKQASILKAMLLGIKTELSDQLKDELNRAGIRHLTAISGMHTIILLNALMYLFLAMGLWRKQAFVLTTAFIVLFVVLTGVQPSTLRASIMASILLLAQVIGRMNNAIKAIVLTALIMLLFNPNLLFDVGFELSFLAVLGINYLTPIFSHYLRKLPKTLGLKNILIMTLSAQLFTLPILIYNFGYVSLIAPFTNLLILPTLPFILILGILSVVFALFSHFLSLIFVFTCHFLVTYLLKITNIFSSFTFSSIHLGFSWLLVIIFYILLFYFIYDWKKNHRFKILSF